MQGIWNRRYLTTPDHRDTSTRVTWMQAGDTHIDLRLSTAFCQLPARPLHEQDPSSLREIAGVVAFAGKTSVVDAVCAWTRQMNYQGPQIAEDIGALSWAGSMLIERGVHDVYEEGWDRQTNGPQQTLRMSDEQGQLIFLCSVSNCFAMARANPDNLHESTSMIDRVNVALKVHNESQLVTLFDQEFCFGKIEHGSATITQSSNPARVGTQIFKIKGQLGENDAIDIVQQDFFGRDSICRYTRMALT